MSRTLDSMDSKKIQNLWHFFSLSLLVSFSLATQHISISYQDHTYKWHHNDHSNPQKDLEFRYPCNMPAAPTLLLAVAVSVVATYSPRKLEPLGTSLHQRTQVSLVFGRTFILGSSQGIDYRTTDTSSGGYLVFARSSDWALARSARLSPTASVSRYLTECHEWSPRSHCRSLWCIKTGTVTVWI